MIMTKEEEEIKRRNKEQKERKKPERVSRKQGPAEAAQLLLQQIFLNSVTFHSRRFSLLFLSRSFQADDTMSKFDSEQFVSEGYQEDDLWKHKSDLGLME